MLQLLLLVLSLPGLALTAALLRPVPYNAPAAPEVVHVAPDFTLDWVGLA